MTSMLTRAGYGLDARTGIWCHAGYSGIAYSDGDELEQRISSVIEAAGDLSVFSEELREHCVDWPSLYHLSAQRANILRPFEGHLGGHVLEIGAGCGAITRYLGECGGTVLALEGSPRRATIARSRTRDLSNVNVVAERFDDFQCDAKFDLVTLIGVLEYANLFTSGEDPALTMLERARALLKPGGLLIIAIENQLGLKYFAGAAEDHVGRAMYGIEDHYRSDQPQTFGRKVLSNLLVQAGYGSTSFLAPFPDYKLPTSIVSEAGFQAGDFDAAAFAWQSVWHDPQLPRLLAFSPELVWPIVAKNGLALDLANSFLIVARNDDSEVDEQATLAWHYSTARRKDFCKETRFVRSQDGQIEARYRMLSAANAGSPAVSGQLSLSVPEKSAYILGRPLSQEIVEILSRDGWTFEEVARFLRTYIGVLESLLAQPGDGEQRTQRIDSPCCELPSFFFDIVPHNIIVAADGTHHLIDQEWKLAGDISAGFLMFRSLVNIIAITRRIAHSSETFDGTRVGLVLAIFHALGWSVTREAIVGYAELEAEIQLAAKGGLSKLDAMLAWLVKGTLVRDNLSESAAECEARSGELNTQLQKARRDLQGLMHENQKIKAQLLNETQKMEAKHQFEKQELEARYWAMETSTFWRLTLPLRRIVQRLPPSLIRGSRSVARLGYWIVTPHRTAERSRALREHGFMNVLANGVPPQEPAVVSDTQVYGEWIRQRDTLTEADRLEIRAAIDAFGERPLISIVMPVYNTSEAILREAIASVQAQLYPRWELCIADDASPEPHVIRVLTELAMQDKRIVWMRRDTNGHIAAASNSALELASGEFVALMDHDDLLAEHALYEIVAALQERPNTDILYSDEDGIDENGNRLDPYFKPDFSYDLLLGQNLISHLGVYRRSLLERVGGFRLGLEGSQDHDLALRCIEQTTFERIVHVPEMLYHWRKPSDPISFSQTALDRCVAASRQAVQEHLTRQRVKGELVPTVVANPLVPSWNRIRWPLPEPAPLVSVIIPTRDRADLLAQCVEGLLNRTDYDNIEIIVADNDSVEPETKALFQSWMDKDAIRVLPVAGEFNYSRLNNEAVRLARGEVILLLNNDVDVIEGEWLRELVSLAIRPEIGCVGAKLLYADKRVQHAGIRLGGGYFDGGPGVGSHLGLYCSSDDPGYFGAYALTRDVVGVTGACLAVRREVYDAVEGLDERNLAVAFNDVDFCLKVHESGYRNLWTPFAVLFHLESASRGSDLAPEKLARFHREARYMRQRWAHLLDQDPFYSRHFNNFSGRDYEFALGSSRTRSWNASHRVTVHRLLPSGADSGEQKLRSKIAVSSPEGQSFTRDK